MNLRVLALLGMASGLLLLSTTACGPGTGGSGGTGGSETTGGKGGTGGTGGTGGSTSSTGGGGTGGAGGGMGGSGGGMANCAMKCLDIIASGGTKMPCAGSGAETYYNALKMCTCDAAKCKTACDPTACAAMPKAPDTACLMCLQDSMKGCGAEFVACSMN